MPRSLYPVLKFPEEPGFRRMPIIRARNKNQCRVLCQVLNAYAE